MLEEEADELLVELDQPPDTLLVVLVEVLVFCPSASAWPMPRESERSLKEVESAPEADLWLPVWAVVLVTAPESLPPLALALALELALCFWPASAMPTKPRPTTRETATILKIRMSVSRIVSTPSNDGWSVRLGLLPFTENLRMCLGQSELAVRKYSHAIHKMVRDRPETGLVDRLRPGAEQQRAADAGGTYREAVASYAIGRERSSSAPASAFLGAERPGISDARHAGCSGLVGFFSD
ncbi:hypothetical protein [Benzoatithermus flavus]|uniref:hypothetical protein n=1 Tax=Benzoatithermus flavus TaxID=3108223 RepID=UPI003AAF8686